jgi:hypothetical protein
MNTGSPISPNSRAWRDLYKTVLRLIRPNSRSALRKQRKHLH